MEASAIQARATVGRGRVAIGTPLLRLRSDQQLVALFRAGNEDAFRVIHDRYQHRLLVYARQMLPGAAADAEDILQEVFVRAYRGLRTNDRELNLRPWLYRVARNRCVDEMRRPALPPAQELFECVRVPAHDPVIETEQRDTLRRLVTDVGRLPEQQRSALLMRELGGMSYTEVGQVLSVSIPAVKSLLVRARIGLAQSVEARDTACSEIRHELTLAHDRGVRPNGMARRHLRDCPGCREYRAEVRGLSRQLAALAPAVGPLGVIAKLLGIGGGGSAAAGGAAAGGGAAAASTGSAVSIGVLGAAGTHVAALLAAVVITAGGAVELHSATSSQPASHHARQAARLTHTSLVDATFVPVSAPAPAPSISVPSAPPASAPASPKQHAGANQSTASSGGTGSTVSSSSSSTATDTDSSSCTSSTAVVTSTATEPTCDDTGTSPSTGTDTDDSSCTSGTAVVTSTGTDPTCDDSGTSPTTGTPVTGTAPSTGSSTTQPTSGTPTYPGTPSQPTGDGTPTGSYTGSDS